MVGRPTKGDRVFMQYTSQAKISVTRLHLVQRHFELKLKNYNNKPFHHSDDYNRMSSAKIAAYNAVQTKPMRKTVSPEVRYALPQTRTRGTGAGVVEGTGTDAA